MKTGLRVKNGFTLIELLVVIAIIAILASILFPVFSSARRQALKTQCLSDMKQLGVAFAMYRNDWESKFPLGGFKVADADYSSEWQNVIWRYVKNDKLFRCPSCPAEVPDPNNPGYAGPDASMPRTPVSYLYNMGLGSNISSAYGASVAPTSQVENAVKSPSDCILLLEGFSKIASSYKGVDCHGQTKTLWLRDYTFYNSASSITGGNVDVKKKSWGLPYHKDGGCVLFVDCHVKYYKYNDSASLESVLPWMVNVALTSSNDPNIIGQPGYSWNP